jgi:hypothetical protein
MNRNLQMVALTAATAASFLAGCAAPPRITARTDPSRPSIVQTREGYDTFGRRWSDQTSPSAARPAALSRNEAVVQHFTGTITDIDYATREVTLRGPQGRTETFFVDKSVQRFNEAKVGDKVSLDYYLGLNAEVRKPAADEERNPLVVLEPTGRTGPEEAPAAAGMRRIRALCTIEGIDRANETVTVKGPRGKYFVTRVADPSRLDQVRVGDTMVLTFTEAAAIALRPAGNEPAY